MRARYTAFAAVLLALLSSSPFVNFGFGQQGVPVGSAVVAAVGAQGEGGAVTGPDGFYKITKGLIEGNYIVTVIADGYLVAQQTNVDVRVGTEVGNVNFFLRKSGGVSGRIVGSDGKQLPNVPVFAFRASVLAWSASTVSDGTYKIITNLMSGTYNISSFQFVPGYIAARKEGVQVTAGVETTNVDLTLQVSGIISGKVTFENGTAVAGAAVAAFSKEEESGRLPASPVTTGPEGFYRINTNLASGTYSVFAFSKWGFGTVENVTVTAGRERGGVNIVIMPISFPATVSGRLSGTVKDKATGKDIESAFVSASGPAGSGSAPTDQAGRYLINEGLGTGTYTVTASASGYRKQNVSGVSVTAGQETPGVNFQLEPVPEQQSGRISGTVRGEPNPIPEFPETVVLVLAVVVIMVVFIRRSVKQRH